jgi:predicted Zn finger-like uncharacterized protein
MTVACPDCRSVFRVDPAKVPASGVRARCSVCGGVIAITGGTLPVMVTPVSAGIVQPAFATPAESSGAVMEHASSAQRVAAPPHSTGSAFAAVAARTPTPAMSPGAVDVATETPRRPINPFLKADPSQRARRLARALVSDLVAYYPQKRDEGLKNGTLRQLFREEIKKSYEEYVDQVGRELAESTPHFQDALNEILGGGRKLF